MSSILWYLPSYFDFTDEEKDSEDLKSKRVKYDTRKDEVIWNCESELNFEEEVKCYKGCIGEEEFKNPDKVFF